MALQTADERFERLARLETENQRVLGPIPVQSEPVAVHTLLIALECTIATQVLSTGTESAVVQVS